MPRHSDPSKRPDRFKEYIFLNNNGIDNRPNSECVFQAKQPALLQRSPHQSHNGSKSPLFSRVRRAVLELSVFAPAALYLPGDVPATQLHGGPATYRALLPRLQPGDELVLESGQYPSGLPLRGLSGTPDHPIRIYGPSSGARAVFLARPERNTITLSNAAYVEISNLVLDGLDLQADAVKADGSKQCSFVHHITLRDLLIVRHGADQQIVGISSLCPAWDWVIRDNVIVGAGTGLYLGQSDGSAPFVGGLIERNFIVDTLGYNLQIKHQNKRPLESGMPKQQRVTIIRQNVFSKAQHASSGDDARPNLLVGHFPKQGEGSEDVYEISNNLFFCNPGEALLQGEGNLSITANLFINPMGDALVMQPHHDVPRRITIRNNFVAAAGRGISISKASVSYSQSVSDNWVFAFQPLQGGNQQANRIASFPPPKGAVTEWSARAGTAPGGVGSAPLLRFAERVCLGQTNTGSSEFVGKHPVCELIAFLSKSAGKKLSGAANSDRLNAIGKRACLAN